MYVYIILVDTSDILNTYTFLCTYVIICFVSFTYGVLHYVGDHPLCVSTTLCGYINNFQAANAVCIQITSTAYALPAFHLSSICFSLAPEFLHLLLCISYTRVKIKCRCIMFMLTNINMSSPHTRAKTTPTNTYAMPYIHTHNTHAWQYAGIW